MAKIHICEHKRSNFSFYPTSIANPDITIDIFSRQTKAFEAIPLRQMSKYVSQVGIVSNKQLESGLNQICHFHKTPVSTPLPPGMEYGAICKTFAVKGIGF